MRIYPEPFQSHSPNASPLLDKATAALCWPSSTAWIPHQQHPARLRSQGCPCSPTFHISFPRANPPHRSLTPQPAEPAPPLPTIKSRLLLDSKSTGLSHELMRSPFPQTHVLNITPTWICRSTHIWYCRNGSSASNFTQYRRNPKWEIWFVTLSCQNWTYLEHGEIKKGMYFYSYSFIWQYRSLKCNWI